MSLDTWMLYITYCCVTYEDKNNVKSESFCFPSDDMEHDARMIYHSQKLMMEYLKVNYPQDTNVEYFTDGCAA